MNNSGVGNATAPSRSVSAPNMPDPTTIVFYMVVTMALALFGNFLLAIVILRGRSRLHHLGPVQMLILHNCTADILFALLTLFPNVLTETVDPQLYHVNAACKLTKMLQVLPMYASPFLLVALSADRFHAICRPLISLQHNRYRRPRNYAIAAWSLSFVCSLPQLIVFGTRPPRNTCLHSYTARWQMQLYVLYFNVAAWLVPSLFAGYFYLRVCRTVLSELGARSQGNSRSSPKYDRPASRRTSNDPAVRKAGAEPTDNLLSPSGQSADWRRRNSSFVRNNHPYVRQLRDQSTSWRKQSTEYHRKRMHTIKLTLTIVACNFFLWSPFCVSNILYAIFPSLLSPTLLTYIMIVGNLNSCVNPWIYVLFNWGQVRRALCAREPEARKSTSTSSVLGRMGATLVSHAQAVRSHSTAPPPFGKARGRRASSPTARFRVRSIEHPAAAAAAAAAAASADDADVGECGSPVALMSNGDTRWVAVKPGKGATATERRARFYLTRPPSDISLNFIDQETARSPGRPPPIRIVVDAPSQ